jgi:hypothetical protein
VRSFCGLRHAAFCIAVANRHGTAPDGRCEARRVTPQMLVRNHSGTRARSNQGLREPPSGRRSTPTAVVMPAWPPCSAAGSAPELSVGRSSGPLRVLLHRRNPRVRAGAVPPRPSEKPADRTAWCPLGRDRDSQRRLLALGGQQLRPPGTSKPLLFGRETALSRDRYSSSQAGEISARRVFRFPATSRRLAAWPGASTRRLRTSVGNQGVSTRSSTSVPKIVRRIREARRRPS